MHSFVQEMPFFDFRPNQYYYLASSVVFFYDYVLTLPQEIKHIWFYKFTFINMLLIALRYITAATYIRILWLTFSLVFIEHPIICKKLNKLPGILGIVCQGLTLVFLITRIFAIYDKKKWILYTTIPMGLLNIVLSSYALAGAEIYPASDLQTFATGAIEQTYSSSSSCSGTRLHVFNGSTLRYELSYIAIILFDTWIFILSVTRMGRMYRAERLVHSESSIVNILLRDGIILYATLTLNNAFNFFAFMLNIQGNTETNQVKLSTLLFVVSSGTNSEVTHALSAILVSRMIFNLREAGTEIYEGAEEWRSRTERSTKDMQFHIPITFPDGRKDIPEESDGYRGTEGGSAHAEASV